MPEMGADDARESGAVEAVLFDYGLVLTMAPDARAWAEMGRVLGLEERALDAVYWRHRAAYDVGELGGRVYWHTVAESAGRTVNEAQVEELIALDTTLWTQANEPMIAWVERLRRAGTKTGILSNLGDAMAAGVLERMDWMAGFDCRVFSHQVGAMKPQRAAYEAAVLGLGVRVERILFVDDRAENVAGAQVVGMQAIRYGGQAEFEGEMAARGLAGLWQRGAMDGQEWEAFRNSTGS